MSRVPHTHRELDRAGRRRRRLPLAALVGLLAMLAVSVGGAGGAGGASDYASPLYLSGSSSSLVTGSYKLVTSAGPGTPASAPTATAGAAGALSGSYMYAYSIVDPTGGETPVSPPVTTTVTSQSIDVGGLPTGVLVHLYRLKSGFYNRVAELPANTSATYTDNMDDATASTRPSRPCCRSRRTGLPRPRRATRTSRPAPTHRCRVPPRSSHRRAPRRTAGAGSTRAPAPSSFRRAPGTFQAKFKSNYNIGGTLHLVVGLWKVTTSGGAITGSTRSLSIRRRPRPRTRRTSARRVAR